MPRLYNGVRLLGSGPCLDNVAKLDAGAVPYIAACMERGLQVDLDHFHRMSKTLDDDMEQITERVFEMTGYRINLDSGDQIADLLFKKMGLKQARVKFTKSGKRESVIEEVLTAIQHDHPVIPEILDYKELSKLNGTYVKPMPGLAKRAAFGEWRMYPNLGQTRVPSGRLNCKEPNLLAMPSRTERGRQIREGFITRPGWTMLSVDESQIEVRVAAHSSQDENLIRIYENEEDIYSDFAISAFRLPDQRFRNAKGKWEYPGVDKMEHRYPSKTCVLAAIFDVTAKGLQEQMPIVCANCGKEAKQHDCHRFEPLWTEDKCQDLLNAFYMRYPGLLRDRKRHHQMARSKGYIWDMWGRVLHLAAVKSVLEWVVSSALREGGNFPYQCLSGESRVLARGWGLVPLRNLAGTTATLWDGTQWSTGQVVGTGKKETLRITLHGGLALECSPDHRIRLRSVWGAESWVRAEELLRIDTKNHKVVVGDEAEPAWDWPDSIPPCYPCQLTFMGHDPASFGEWLGRIASDGNILSCTRTGKPKAVRLFVAEHEKAAVYSRLLHTTQQIAPHVGVRTEVKPGYAPMHRIEVTSLRLASILHEWGVKTQVPPPVWRNSKMLEGYLRGIFDGDGGVSLGPRGTAYLTFGGNNGRLPLARDVQLALLWLGIRARLHVYPYMIRLSIQRRDLPTFAHRVGFMNPKKQSRLLEHARNCLPLPRYGRVCGIESIERRPFTEMFDFVSSTTGRFWAEGFVVHNSGAQGTIKLTMAQVMDDLEEAQMLGDVVHPLLQIHDELLMEVRNDVLEEVSALLVYRFETCAPLRVPIKAGAAHAPTWGSIAK